MVKPILCSDSRCPSKSQCYRYNADPVSELKMAHLITIEPTLRSIGEDRCSFYLAIKIPVTALSYHLSGVQV